MVNPLTKQRHKHLQVHQTPRIPLILTSKLKTEQILFLPWIECRQRKYQLIIVEIRNIEKSPSFSQREIQWVEALPRKYIFWWFNHRYITAILSLDHADLYGQTSTISSFSVSWWRNSSSEKDGVWSKLKIKKNLWRQVSHLLWKLWALSVKLM
jgi:hypothetical protein